jgi:leader peptidase (prepilin peptidase) / N-methyltransferase
MSAINGVLLASIVFGGGFGLLIGSFVNVIAYRVPAGMSLIAPPSSCPRCGEHVRPYDNVPVLSWLLLRARCRFCKEPISARYPVVELMTAVLFVLTAARFFPAGIGSGSATLAISGVLSLVAFLYLGAISVALALIDLDTHKLPNVIVLPSYLVGIALLGVSSALSGDWAAILRGGIGMGALFLFYLLLGTVYPGGMGFGDVKLAGLLGLFLGFLGWAPLLVGAFSAFLLGGVFSMALIVARKVNRKSGIPFGPWMLAGAWVGIFFGETLWQLYLTSTGLN